MAKNIVTDIDVNEVEIDDHFNDYADKQRYRLNDNLWEKIERNVPKNTMKLMRHIAMYRDKYISGLETPYPIDRLVWRTNLDDAILFDTLGIEPEELYQYTKDIENPATGYIDPYLSKGKGQTLKLYQFCFWLLYRYYLLHDKTKEANALKYYIGYNAYCMAMWNSFRQYAPDPDIMRFTINNLSYKNKIKSLGSVHKWIYYLVDAITITYDKRLKRGADFDYLYVIDKCRDKFKDAIKRLHNAQDKNTKSKSYLHTNTEQNDDGTMKDVSSLTADVIRLADQCTAGFFENPISEKCIKYALNKGKGASISEKDLRNTLLVIADDVKNQEDVRTFYQSIFYLFLSLGTYTLKDIKSASFISEMMKLYKPGNTIDKNRIIIREIMDKWLIVGSKTYRTTSRVATQSSFRKSIYDYFIFKIVIDK